MQGPNPWCALKVPPAWRCGPARGRAALLTLTALTAKHCVVGSTGRARPDCSLRRSSRAQPTSPASPEREPTQPLHRLRGVPAYVAIEHQIKDLGRDLDDKDRELRELRRAAGRAESECSRIAADLTSARAEAAALAEQVAAAEAARAAADARLAQVQEARAPGWAAVMTAGSVGLAGYMEWGVKSLLPAVVHAVYRTGLKKADVLQLLEAHMRAAHTAETLEREGRRADAPVVGPDWEVHFPADDEVTETDTDEDVTETGMEHAFEITDSDQIHTV